jgi:hypothetical protein
VLVLAILPACTGRSSDPPKADLSGEYRIIIGERNGTPIDQKELLTGQEYRQQSLHVRCSVSP